MVSFPPGERSEKQTGTLPSSWYYSPWERKGRKLKQHYYVSNAKLQCTVERTGWVNVGLWKTLFFIHLCRSVYINFWRQNVCPCLVASPYTVFTRANNETGGGRPMAKRGSLQASGRGGRGGGGAAMQRRAFAASSRGRGDVLMKPDSSAAAALKICVVNDGRCPRLCFLHTIGSLIDYSDSPAKRKKKGRNSKKKTEVSVENLEHMRFGAVQLSADTLRQKSGNSDVKAAAKSHGTKNAAQRNGSSPHTINKSIRRPLLEGGDDGDEYVFGDTVLSRGSEGKVTNESLMR